MASSQGKNEPRFADWMAALPDSIRSTPLTNLAIPAQAKYFSEDGEPSRGGTDP